MEHKQIILEQNSNMDISGHEPTYTDQQRNWATCMNATIWVERIHHKFRHKNNKSSTNTIDLVTSTTYLGMIWAPNDKSRHTTTTQWICARNNDDNLGINTMRRQLSEWNDGVTNCCPNETMVAQLFRQIWFEDGRVSDWKWRIWGV